MKNNYAQIISEAKYQLLNILNKHFNEVDRELRVMVGGINLLGRKGNAIENSTLPGFAFEEFMTSKLIEETKDNDGIEKIQILKEENSNNNSSYDVFGKYKGILFLINLKAEKNLNSNNAVSAINQLWKDYCSNKEQIKCFIVLKVKYSIGESQKDKERVLIVENVSAFALEEIDFSNGHKQDFRNWSSNSKKISGRLIVSKSFREKNSLESSQITYEKLWESINSIYEKLTN